MANEIYSSSWWGIGPCNDVGWGIIYKQYAGCGNNVQPIIDAFVARVIADGGTVESQACLDIALTFLTDNPIALVAPANSIAPAITGTVEQGQTLYSFRHSGAIEIFKRTGSITKLQKAMGHSSINVSLTYLRGLEVPELNEDDMPMV